MPKVSVIIPVFNAENYLERSIKSVLQQSEKDIEVILINDGSTDKSESIINSFACIDKRVFTFNIINSGVSVARNLGIEKASGEYIMFLDADDWIESVAIEILLNLAETYLVDFIRFEYSIDIMNRSSILSKKIDEVNGIINLETLRKIYLKTTLFNSIWSLFIRKSIIVVNDITFPVNYIYAEDMVFNAKLLSYSNVVYYYEAAIYHYVVNEHSIVNTVSISKVKKKIEDIYHTYLQLFEYSELWELDSIKMKQEIAYKTLKILDGELRKITYWKIPFVTKRKFVKEVTVKYRQIFVLAEGKTFSIPLYLLKYNMYIIYYLYYKARGFLKSFSEL